MSFARVLDRATRRACKSAQRPYHFRGPVGGGLFGGVNNGPPGAGLKLWFNGTAPGIFADFAGTQPAAAPYGRVARVDQPSPAPAGSWLTANQTTSRGWKDPAGVDAQYGATTTFAQPVGITLTANACVFGFSFQYRLGAPGSATSGIFNGTAAANDFGLAGQFGGFLFISWGGGIIDTTLSLNPGDVFYGWIKYGAALVSWNIVQNGVLHVGSSAVAPPASALTGVTINKYRTSFGQYGYAQLLGYDNTLGTVDTAGILAFLSKNLESLPLSAPLVAVSGDSISFGSGADPQVSQFFLAQFNLAGNATPPRLLLAGTGARTIGNNTATFAAQIGAFYSALRGKNILCVQVLTNSMPCAAGNEAATAAAVLTAYYNLCDIGRAQGWRTISFTCLPRSDAGAGTGFPGCWAIVNADIRANHGAHSDDFADVASVPGISLIADSAAGPNFQADHLHPTDAGQGLAETVVLPAIQRQLAA